MNISKLKNSPKTIIFAIVAFVICVILVTVLFVPKNNSDKSNNSQNLQNNQTAPNTFKNLVNGKFSDTFNYDGINIKLVESGILTAKTQTNLPEFCNLSKMCSAKKLETKDNNPDKDIYYIGLLLTNTTPQITVKDMIFDPSGGSTKLINSKNEELTINEFPTRMNEYCSANINRSDSSRDILPSESRFVNYCFALPKGTEIKNFKTKLNRPFFVGFDLKEKNASGELSIELKPDYYSSYDQIQFASVKKTALGQNTTLKNLKTTLKEVKLEDIENTNRITKLSEKRGEIKTILELENTGENDIEVEKAYDFVLNHQIGLSQKSYSYNFADKMDATEFKTSLKLIPKQKSYMFLTFDLMDKNIDLSNYHLSVIYNSAARKDSFEKNDTEFAAFALK